ncbi:hypothetical protein PWG15_23975 (plasmid) [Ensifer adhaerens]|uniref:hypothetical protein n=1 Tax=Ensifer adhaerens TaxID=106592 RepID=UPI0023AA0A27|nr:hypothetical protein [Ensifer adhaerens]WDZ80821.1 hypothetical protein PWG15_23975 [Ensifer adhaerens]
MLELAILLTVGFFGGCFRRVAWIFLSSVVVLLSAPIYLVQYREIVSVLPVILLTLLAIMTVQLGSLTGFLVLPPRRKTRESAAETVDTGSASPQKAFFSMSAAGSGRDAADE